MTDTANVQGNRQQLLALAVAASLGVAVVLALLYVSLSAGHGAGAPRQPSALEVPDGSYTALCAALANQGGDLGRTPTQDQVLTLFRTVDFGPLIAVAPAGLVPSLEVLRDQRDAVFAAIGPDPDLLTVNKESLPDGFMPALITTASAIRSKCT